jgi:hypothetical protein
LNTYSYSYEYIIIKGANVSFRSSPVVNAKVIDTFKTDELVFLIQKSDKEIMIGNDNYYWYKVKRLDKKIGWVYGKYCHYLDAKKIPEKYYKQVLDNFLITPSITEGSGVGFYNVGFEYIKNKNLIMVKYINPGGLIIFAEKRYYELLDSNIKEIFQTSYNSKVLFKENYIFDMNKESIFIHKKRKEDNVFEIVERTNLRGNNYLKKLYDSYLEFDEKTMILTKYYRDIPATPMRIEKYHFNEQIDKFEKIE